MTPLAESVARFIDRASLLPAHDVILVAVSGGADSLTLLGILDELAPQHGWQLTVATIDHGWTPAGAAACDAVERLAREFGLDCERHRLVDVAGSEAAARDARLGLLRERAAALGAVVALGHTADDRVETMLLNLLRGAGVTGLGAMLPRSGQIVRPLLELTRQQTRAYVTARGWVAQDDPTNASRRFDRNRLRLDVMPILRAFRPGARPNLQRAARLLGAEREALARYAAQLLIAHWQIPRPEQALDGLAAGVLHLDDWPALPEPERWLVLRAFLARVGGDLRDVGLADIERLDALALGPPDAGLQRLGELRLGRCHDRLVRSWASASSGARSGYRTTVS